AVDQVVADFAFAIGDRNFYKDVSAPFGDLQSLAFHLSEIIRKDLERNWTILDIAEYVLGKRFIVRNASLAHEGRVGGEALYALVLVEPKDVRLVRAIGEDLDFQFLSHFQSQKVL